MPRRNSCTELADSATNEKVAWSAGARASAQRQRMSNGRTTARARRPLKQNKHTTQRSPLLPEKTLLPYVFWPIRLDTAGSHALEPLHHALRGHRASTRAKMPMVLLLLRGGCENGSRRHARCTTLDIVSRRRRSVDGNQAVRYNFQLVLEHQSSNIIF